MYINRKILNHIKTFLYTHKNEALLITGARQVGKTYIIREAGKAFNHFIEFNLYDNKKTKEAITRSSNSKDLLTRLSALSSKKMKPGETLIFFDEVQECPELITAIKFLVEEGSYQYVLSGSLLGVELSNVKSLPVGYMTIYNMYPIDFEEFLTANGIDIQIIEKLKNTYNQKSKVDSIIHDKIMEFFRLYLVVGGMPAVVKKYLQTHNLREVRLQQLHILDLYKIDVSKYDINNKLYLNEIISLIPSQLNASNKRFILKNLNENFKFSRYSNSFIWLKNAGIAIPVYATAEPVDPLLLTKSANLFKLFLNDVGLLTSMYPQQAQFDILNEAKNANHGALFENYVAQELQAHGYDTYYYNNKKNGEVDFLINKEGKILPIEVKSGKAYKKHSALLNLLSNNKYDINNAYVYHNGNLEIKNSITYLPVYMISFLENSDYTDDFIYEISLA